MDGLSPLLTRNPLTPHNPDPEMPLMYISRRSVLIGLVVVSLLFLAAQIYLLKWAGSPGIFNWSSLWEGASHKHSRKIAAYRAVKVFADAAAKFSVPVFLIEPACLNNMSLLKQVDTNNVYPGKCKYLCGMRNITTFGVLDARLISDDFLQFLQDKINIKWTISYGQDPRTLTVDNQETLEIPLHYFFEYSGQFIHLVVFYERSGSYLWHGPVNEDLTQSRWRPSKSSCFKNINTKKLKFGGIYAGAYSKMEFTVTKADGVQLRIPKHIHSFLEQIPFSRFLECDYHQARAFRRLYGHDESPEEQQFRHSAKDLLEKGKQALDEQDVRFWLSSGTCLGWYRECDIIVHSQDVDFGMWIRDYKSSIIQDFDSRGLTLKHQFGKISDSFELSFLDDGIKLDIFFFYDEKDHMWNGGTEVRSGNKYKYVFPKFTLCWTDLLGLKVRVPCDTRRYIEANYGKEWNHKVTTWDWKSSPPNVRPNGEWERDEWSEVIQVF